MTTVDSSVKGGDLAQDFKDKLSLEDGTISKDSAADKLRQPRRSPRTFRAIPRSPVNDDFSPGKGELGGKRVGGGVGKGHGRVRNMSESSVTSTRSQRSKRSTSRRRRNVSETSIVSEDGEGRPMMKTLRDSISEKYDKKGITVFNSYVKHGLEQAKFSNTARFLDRCYVLGIVPNKYRLSNDGLKNTKSVVRTLDYFSMRIMFADLKYNQLREFQVKKLLADNQASLKALLDEELHSQVTEATQALFERRSKRYSEQQEKIFESLVKEYGITEEEKAEGEEKLKQRAERRKARQEQRALDALKAKEEKDADKKDEAEKDQDDEEKKDDAKSDDDEEEEGNESD